jgi:hypothetical protein
MPDLSVSPRSEDCMKVISAGHGFHADVECVSPKPWIVVVRNMTKSLAAPDYDADNSWQIADR